MLDCFQAAMNINDDSPNSNPCEYAIDQLYRPKNEPMDPIFIQAAYPVFSRSMAG